MTVVQEPSERSPSPHVAAALVTQAWENVRHIRNERIWFSNIYVAVMAGGLALLGQSQRLWDDRLISVSLLLFLGAISTMGLLTSLRLIAELEHAMGRVRLLATRLELTRLLGSLDVRGEFGTRIKLRWVFPIFYAVGAMAMVALAIERLVR